MGQTRERETEVIMLDRLLKRRYRKETLKIGMKLCDVLQYLHSHHPPILFRDLKPANIMRTPAGEIFLIDFGLAGFFDPRRERDTKADGSIGYAAPEQYGQLTTPQSDIYSLGAVLHQKLSGCDPATNKPNLFTFPPLHLFRIKVSG
jgi:serine/threonine protein kinase